MESDQDDIYDSNDDESLNDSAGQTATDNYNDCCELVENDDSVDHKEKNYVVLKEEDIRRRQEDDITSVSSVLSISRVFASVLLRSYKWSVNTVNDAWFADEDRVRNSFGLLKKPTVRFRNATQLNCGICFEVYPIRSIETLVCGHPYCTNCWKGYISAAINDGPICLMLRCPDPSCNAAVLDDLIDKLASNEDKKKYHRYIVRSYIECNRKTKWCPAAGCDCAVEYDIGSGSYDVSCLCSNSFCWNCTEEAHRPVDCETVTKWILKNSAESENVNWILANSKPCPKCKKPIEKNQGCNHMTCRPPCRYQFCWLCLGAWNSHGGYSCNRFKTEEAEEDEKKRIMAKKYIERYTHYYERWANNHSAMKKAIADLKNVKTVQLKKINEKQNQVETKLEFIIEAWEQIVECRRLLRWTYVYGYYIPDNENGKRQFFEYLQGEAEDGLERLHQCAEQELRTYVAEASDDFNEFRMKLIKLTSVTRKYFENLMRGLENDLPEVSSSSSKSKSKKRKKKNSSDSSSGSDYDYSGRWTCRQCTYVNKKSTRSICHVCRLPR